MRFNDKGMTFVELLVSLSISVLLIGSVLATYMASNEFYAVDVTGQTLQRDADNILNKIIKGKIEPTGVFRLSEATSYNQVSVSELQFTGTDQTIRWYGLSEDEKSVIYHHPTSSGVRDEIIYTASAGITPALRFWIPSGVQFTDTGIGIDVALTQNVNGRAISGSATTMINIRNHSS